MAEHESRKTEEERTQHRQRVRQSPSKQLEALDPDSETAADVSSVESPGVLRDGRFSHPANIGQKARVVSQLQHSHGNAYVQRLLDSKAIQAKLVVNPVNDQYEREADRVAEAVAPASGAAVQRQVDEEKEEEEVSTKPASGVLGPALQRQVEEEEEKEEEEVSTKPAGGAPGPALQRQEEEEKEEEVSTKPAGGRRPRVSADLEARVEAQRGRGHPLGESARATVEPRLGVNLSDVRIHADAESDEMSRQLNARAFTTGKDVFFRGGDYQPGTTEGQKLLAHELTHVAQQSEGAPAPPTSTRAMGEAPALATGGKATSVARQEESDVRIARQPVEVKGEARPATPPPATPAPPLITDAQRTLWNITVIKKIEEAQREVGRRRPNWHNIFDATIRAKDAIPPLIEATGVHPSTAKEMRRVERELHDVSMAAGTMMMRGKRGVPEALAETLTAAYLVGIGEAPAPTPEAE